VIKFSVCSQLLCVAVSQTGLRSSRSQLPCYRIPRRRGQQAKELLAVPDRSKLKGKRDYVILALLVGCALRRNELA
jgi:hypothetical protein